MKSPTTNSARITQLDVARDVGFSTCVVSKVLAGKRGVAPATHEKVMAAAKRLGYQPNAAASLLAAQRHTVRQQLARPVIAYLFPRPEPTREAAFLRACQDMGLDGRCYQVAGRKPTARVLKAQGVNGIVINAQAHWPAGYLEKFDWSGFSLVGIGRVPCLTCHAVTHSAFDHMWHTLEQVVARGYRKPAVLVHGSANARDDHVRLGALMAFNEYHREDGVECRWPSSAPNTADLAPILPRWLPESGADSVITTFSIQWQMLRETGVTILDGFPCASVLMDDDPSSPGALAGDVAISGCLMQTAEHFKRAVSILADLIGRNLRGPVDYPMISLVTPVWREGASLPRR